MTGRVMLVLPYPISANRYWKIYQIKASASKGTKARGIMGPTAEAKEYKRECARIAKACGVEPQPGRLMVTLLLYPNKPLDADKRMRRNPENWDDDVQCIDTNNCSKVALDALQGVLYEDDKWLWDIRCIRQEPDDQGARLAVVIEPMTRPESPRIPLPLEVTEVKRYGYTAALPIDATGVPRGGIFDDIPF